MINNATIISNVHHVVCEKFTYISEKLATEGKFVPEYMVSCLVRQYLHCDHCETHLTLGQLGH
jgi:hypothetical protein